ncbi:hypothetical protein [Ruminococcus flavefaciens]|uniref:hypothetical protein n=2 Tax=Ruminococcus flavefaciens TaxID=1265 RepID=UPI0026EB8278|nr:hypothetical protein [Ruminococcus flavefaciens]
MKLLKKIQKHWITFWMITAILIFSVFSGIYIYAAYMGNSNMKRSISTRSISDIVFSSNVMKAPAQARNLHESNSAAEYEYPVTVCNFEQMSPATHAKEIINYELTAELVRYDGTAYVPVTSTVYREDGTTPKVFKIRQTADNNTLLSGAEYDLNSGTFQAIYENQTLPDSISATDTFTLVFDREEMKKDSTDYFIQITATPTNTTAVSGTITRLQAQISVSKGKDYGSRWRAVLTEPDDADYDAYNVQVSGSGAGTIEIMWKTEYFNISDMFLMDTANTFRDSTGAAVTGDSAIITVGEWSKVILEVDSYTKENKYDIQFFKKQSHTFSASDPVSAYIKEGEYKEKQSGT